MAGHDVALPGEAATAPDRNPEPEPTGPDLVRLTGGGGAAADVLIGDASADRFADGAGNDTLHGGGGRRASPSRRRSGATSCPTSPAGRTGPELIGVGFADACGQVSETSEGPALSVCENGAVPLSGLDLAALSAADILVA